MIFHQVGSALSLMKIYAKKFKKNDLMQVYILDSVGGQVIQGTLQVEWSLFEDVFDCTYVGGVLSDLETASKEALMALISRIKSA